MTYPEMNNLNAQSWDGDYTYVAPGESYHTQGYNTDYYSNQVICDTTKPVYVASGWDGTLCYNNGHYSSSPHMHWVYVYYNGVGTSLYAHLECNNGAPPSADLATAQRDEVIGDIKDTMAALGF